MFNITPTTEINAFLQLKNIDEISENTFQAFVDGNYRAWSLFWIEGESPEIKMQLLGTKALDMFTRSAQAQGFIKLIMTALGKEYTELGVPEEYEIVWNEDGSGVINRIITPSEENLV